uniref:Uncharacterized protein n=2 Tax=Schistocephalus solidus TaxID=70667 RepID=A0A0X3Q221_SCHSO
MKQKRGKLLKKLIEGIKEGARAKNGFSDPLVAINYAKNQETRRMTESLRLGNRRVRRSVPNFKPPSPYAILGDSDDVVPKKSSNFLVETLPENLQLIKKNTYIHFRICVKPVIPEEVNTDRKLQFPLENCDYIEDGHRVLLEETDLPFPWLYGTFLEDEFVIIRMGGKVVLRYSPHSRHLSHYLTDASAYSHRSNRSVLISLLIDRQLINQPTEVLVESQSTIVAPIHDRRAIPSGGGYFIKEPLRGRSKWPAYFNFTVNTVSQPVVITLETDSSAPRILFNDLAGSGEFSDIDWLPSRSGQTVILGDSDVTGGSEFSPAQVVAKMRQLRDSSHRWVYPSWAGEEESYLVQLRVRRFSPVLVIEVGDVVSLHCHTLQPDTDLRVWHSLGAFRTQQQHFHQFEMRGNMSTVDVVLIAVQPTLSWSPDSFVKTGDIYVTDESVLSRVTCANVRGQTAAERQLEPQTLYFVVLNSLDYAAFLRWGAYSMRAGTKGVPLRRPPKAGAESGRKAGRLDTEDYNLIVASIVFVVVPSLMVLIMCRVFRRKQSTESIARPSLSERQEYEMTLRNVEGRLRNLQVRLAEGRGKSFGQGDTRSVDDGSETRTPSANL